MALFGLFSKDKIENENKTKPFQENKSAEEHRDWFSRTRPWHKVSPQIIDAIIDKFGEDPMFEVFVITSMEQDLVTEYQALGRLELVNIPDAVCAQIAGILFSRGSDAALKFHQLMQRGRVTKKTRSLYGTAMNCLEPSIILSDIMIVSYIKLAGLRAVLGKNDDAIKFIDMGLHKIKELEAYSDKFSKSNIGSVANAPEEIRDMQQQLVSMKEEISL